MLLHILLYTFAVFSWDSLNPARFTEPAKKNLQKAINLHMMILSDNPQLCLGAVLIHLRRAKILGSDSLNSSEFCEPSAAQGSVWFT